MDKISSLSAEIVTHDAISVALDAEIVTLDAAIITLDAEIVPPVSGIAPLLHLRGPHVWGFGPTATDKKRTQ